MQQGECLCTLMHPLRPPQADNLRLSPCRSAVTPLGRTCVLVLQQEAAAGARPAREAAHPVVQLAGRAAGEVQQRLLPPQLHGGNMSALKGHGTV